MASAQDKIFVGDIGKVIRVYVGSKLNLSTASLIKFQIKKPNSQLVEWTATVDPTNSYYATYTTVSGDLDLAGKWLLSIEVTFPSGAYHQGSTGSFEVYEQFADTECSSNYIDCDSSC